MYEVLLYKSSAGTGFFLIAFLCGFEDKSALHKKSPETWVFLAERKSAQKMGLKFLGKWRDYLCRKLSFLCR